MRVLCIDHHMLLAARLIGLMLFSRSDGHLTTTSSAENKSHQTHGLYFHATVTISSPTRNVPPEAASHWSGSSVQRTYGMQSHSPFMLVRDMPSSPRSMLDAEAAHAAITVTAPIGQAASTVTHMSCVRATHVPQQLLPLFCTAQHLPAPCAHSRPSQNDSLYPGTQQQRKSHHPEHGTHTGTSIPESLTQPSTHQ